MHLYNFSALSFKRRIAVAGGPNLPGRSDDSGTNNHYDVNVQHAGIAKIRNSPTILGISKVHRWDVAST